MLHHLEFLREHLPKYGLKITDEDKISKILSNVEMFKHGWKRNPRWIWFERKWRFKTFWKLDMLFQFRPRKLCNWFHPELTKEWKEYEKSITND